MMIKILAVVMIVLCLFVSCGLHDSNSASSNNVPYVVEGYEINNSPMEQDNTTFTIEELEEFFDSTSLQTGDIIYLKDIHSRFPIKYLRKAEETESYYIAYPVFEGGKFLVFLNTQLDFDSGYCKLFFAHSLYIHDLPVESDFAKLNNSNTYEDVKTLAPCTVLDIVKASSIDSYSVMRNGEILRCTYSKNEYGILYWDSMEVLSYGDPGFPFAGVLYSDLFE